MPFKIIYVKVAQLRNTHCSIKVTNGELLKKNFNIFLISLKILIKFIVNKSFRWLLPSFLHLLTFLEKLDIYFVIRSRDTVCIFLST